MILSPGFRLESRIQRVLKERCFFTSTMFLSRASFRLPIPEVLITHPPRPPFSTTFVSPVIMCTPASLHVSAMLSKILSKSAIGRPSSSTRPEVRATGSAPITAMSLMVPATASLPMSPPEKKRGFTAWESDFKTMSFITAESSRASSGTSAALPPRCFNTCFLTRSAMTVPPAP